MLNPSDQLVQGQQYTFTLTESSTTYYFTELDIPEATSKLIGLPDFSQLLVTKKDLGFFGGPPTFNVTFVFAGQNASSVQDIANEIIAAWNGIILSMLFVGATTGSTGIANSPTSNGFKWDDLIPSSSALWATAIIAGIFLFVYVGGATLVKRTAGA